ncbi:hypothetical protein HCN44_000243 [Aphidius gifuensis]|uniref:CHHC U11-48K-type domain-containing protein n=1 Tax=Aphidius gifuensis TaxID=684658 RepID=A0A835CQQ2_APHGI|nr:hypothetical protein HCN44_000243 [Aphidius gifuensis]
MDIKLNKEHLIENLMKFSEETTKKLNDILHEVDWNENITEENSVNTICPFDSNHRVPDKNLEQHLDRCQWKAEGYDEQDLPLSIPTVPPDGPSCIKFGNDKRLVPRTSDRLVADFTPEERKILYDYVIANTIPFEIGEEVADLEKLQKENGERKNVSYLELIAQERNLKRRRAKHRGVHTNKKSHLEVLREVINHQMEMLADHVNEKHQLELVKPEKSHENNFEKFNNSKINNYSRDYADDKQRKYESPRDYDDHHHLKRQERSRHSKKSSRDRDKYDERYQNNYDEKKHRTRRDDSHHSGDHHHKHKHKHHKDHHHRSSSSKKSRHDDERPSKRRKHYD